MPLFINTKQIKEQDIIDEMKKMRDKHRDLYPDMSKMERERLLFAWAKENLMERELLLTYAKENISIPTEEIENEAKSDKQSLPQEELVTKLKLDKLMAKLEADISITEKELKKYYKKNRKLYKVPEQIHVKHIVKHPKSHPLGKDEDILGMMKKIKTELDQGKDFEAVGNQYSDCSGPGLDLGYFPRGEMVPAFDKVVFTLKKGETSEIFRTEFGYHIAKLIDRRPELTAPFNQVKSHIRKNIIAEKREKKLEKLVDSLKKNVSMKYVEPETIVNSAIAGFKFPKPLGFTLVKPSGPDCNLACDYCFYLEKDKLFNQQKHRMSESVLEEMIEQAAEQSTGRFNFGWQGGEPTLMGLDFFKKAVILQKKYGGNKKFGNSLQTNGILLTKEWAEFLKDNKFLVGLSIDGKQHIHDRYRKNRAGQGSWETVVEKAKMLLNKGVMVNSLSVVNDYSVDFPAETYNYLKSLGFSHMQFIPIVESDQSGDVAAPFSTSADKYGNFLCKIFDCWRNDFKNGAPATSIRFFDAVFHKYVGMEAPECTLREECGIYLVTEHNGDVFSCDFFVEPDWKLGNVMSDNLLEMLNSKKQINFGQLKSQLPEKCKSCQWLTYCRGGCPKDRIRDPRDHNVSHFCDAYKQFFNHADAFFKTMAEDFLRNNPNVKK